MGALMYRAYTRALAGEMRRRSLAPDAFEIAEADEALESLLGSDDARDVRLGLDLLPGVASSPSAVHALRRVAEHADPEVRVLALVQLAALGDREAATAAAALAGELAQSPDPANRRAAAVALGARVLVPADRSVLVALLGDRDPTVRTAALDAVAADDAVEPEVLRRVVAAVETPRTARSAAGALRRLGDPALPMLAAAVARDGASRNAPLLRAAAAAAVEHGPTIIEPALRDPDRVVVLAALDALEATQGCDVVPAAILDDVFDDAAAHAARAFAARTSLAARDDSLRRALEDEIDLARRLVVAVLAVRHGAGVRDAVRVVDCADGQRQALAVEALDVIISRAEAEVAIPLIRREPARDEQAAVRDPEQWIADLADDTEGVWRSSWLACCARHASGR